MAAAFVYAGNKERDDKRVLITRNVIPVVSFVRNLSLSLFLFFPPKVVTLCTPGDRSARHEAQSEAHVQVHRDEIAKLIPRCPVEKVASTIL